MNPRLTPEAQALKSRKEKQIKDRDAALTRDYNIAFASESGQRVLRHLMETSGFLRSDVTAHPETGAIHVESSLYNMAWRNFYLRIRSRLKADVLAPVELKKMEQDEEVSEIDLFS